MLRVVIGTPTATLAWPLILMLCCTGACAQLKGANIDLVEPGMSPKALNPVAFTRDGNTMKFKDGQSACEASVETVHAEEVITWVKCDQALHDPQANTLDAMPEIRPAFFEPYVRKYENKYGSSSRFMDTMVVWNNRTHGSYVLSLRNYIEQNMVLRFEKSALCLQPDASAEMVFKVQ